MNCPETRFIEALDVLILRGNKLFGDPGSYGEALLPPWPSVAAGAIRSRMLADAHIDPADFAKGLDKHSELGTPAAPGSFTLASFHLARRRKDGSHELLIAPPADLFIAEDHLEKPVIRRYQPTALASGLDSSAPLPLYPVLAETTRAKPASGYWLTESGWARYLHGELPTSMDLVKSSELWRMDERVGVGLSMEQRRADDGKLFSLQAIVLAHGVGFLTTILGADIQEFSLRKSLRQLKYQGLIPRLHSNRLAYARHRYTKDALQIFRRCGMANGGHIFSLTEKFPRLAQGNRPVVLPLAECRENGAVQQVTCSRILVSQPF